MQQPRGGRHGGVFRIAPGGEGIGLRIVDHIDLRHRQVRVGGQLLDDAVEAGRAVAIDLARAVHRKHDLVGLPVSEEVHAQRDKERDHHTRLAADHEADEQEQRGQAREQNGGAEEIHSFSISGWSRRLQGLALDPSHAISRGMTRRFIAHQVRTAKAKPGPSEKRADRAAARELATGAGGKPHWPKEIGGPEGPEPTRYGDWERKGICSDF